MLSGPCVPMEKLTTLFQAASQTMYNQGGGDQNAQNPQGDNNQEEVTDVDFEEVKYPKTFTTIFLSDFKVL